MRLIICALLLLFIACSDGGGQKEFKVDLNDTVPADVPISKSERTGAINKDNPPIPLE